MTVLHLRAGRLFTGSDFLGATELSIDHGVVASITALDPAALSPAEREATLAPGFLDLQINGEGTTDFSTCDPTEFEFALERLPRHGVTTIVPSLPSSSWPSQLTAVRRLTVVEAQPGRARSAGFHLEGPFLAPSRKGAHDPDALREPTAESIDEVLAARESGLPIAKITLAPELPGALEAITRLDDAGVLVSAGHSDADYDRAISGFGAGVRMVTHLFNAQSPLLGREPGLTGAALATAGVALGLIADFVHVHPASCRIAFQAAGERIVLVTDQSPHTTATPRLPDGTIAGSALSFDEGVRNIRSLGIPDEVVLASATRVPARTLGIPAGELRPGVGADVVVLDADWNVVRTIAGGAEAYAA